ncbi:hypothetical protein BDW22DRAFT_1358418 [Trametopsis cervina]|nr:hypothetical protein BDW22DRAFT_1358418 [Trametopsis cervina]
MTNFKGGSNPTSVFNSVCSQLSAFATCIQNTLIVTKTPPPPNFTPIHLFGFVVTTEALPSATMSSSDSSDVASPSETSNNPTVSSPSSSTSLSQSSSPQLSTNFSTDPSTASGMQSSNVNSTTSAMIGGVTSSGPVSTMYTSTTAPLSEVISTAAPSASPSSSPTSQSTPPQALPSLSSKRSNAGAIAGGVIGGLALLVALLLLWFYRKKIARRWNGAHRVAPSAEFLNGPGSREVAFVTASRTASPFAMQGHARSMSMYRDDERAMPNVVGAGALNDGPVPDMPPPPFTTGGFNDPLFEKLSDAARQRTELYAAVTAGSGGAVPVSRSNPFSPSPPPMPVPSAYSSYTSTSYSSSNLSHGRSNTNTTHTSHQRLVDPYTDPYHESDTEEDMEHTSPILNPNKVARMSQQMDALNAEPRARTKSLSGDVGWAM